MSLTPRIVAIFISFSLALPHPTFALREPQDEGKNNEVIQQLRQALQEAGKGDPDAAARRVVQLLQPASTPLPDPVPQTVPGVLLEGDALATPAAGMEETEISRRRFLKAGATGAAGVVASQLPSIVTAQELRADEEIVGQLEVMRFRKSSWAFGRRSSFTRLIAKGKPASLEVSPEETRLTLTPEPNVVLAETSFSGSWRQRYDRILITLSSKLPITLSSVSTSVVWEKVGPIEVTPVPTVVILPFVLRLDSPREFVHIDMVALGKGEVQIHRIAFGQTPDLSRQVKLWEQQRKRTGMGLAIGGGMIVAGGVATAIVHRRRRRLAEGRISGIKSRHSLEERFHLLLAQLGRLELTIQRTPETKWVDVGEPLWYQTDIRPVRDEYEQKAIPNPNFGRIVGALTSLAEQVQGQVTALLVKHPELKNQLPDDRKDLLPPSPQEPEPPTSPDQAGLEEDRIQIGNPAEDLKTGDLIAHEDTPDHHFTVLAVRSNGDVEIVPPVDDRFGNPIPSNVVIGYFRKLNPAAGLEQVPGLEDAAAGRARAEALGISVAPEATVGFHPEFRGTVGSGVRVEGPNFVYFGPDGVWIRDGDEVASFQDSPDVADGTVISAAGLEGQTKLTWRAWYETVGYWGPTKRALEKFPKSTQRVLRVKINTLIKQMVQRGADGRPMLKRGIPNAARVLTSEEFIVGLDMAIRLIEQNIVSDWALVFAVAPAIVRSPTSEAFTSNQQTMETLIVEFQDRWVNLYWALRSALAFTKGKVDMMEAFLEGEGRRERMLGDASSGDQEEEAIIQGALHSRAVTHVKGFQAIDRALTSDQFTIALRMLNRLVKHGVVFYWALEMIPSIALASPDLETFSANLNAFESFTIELIAGEEIDPWVTLAFHVLPDLTQAMTPEQLTVVPKVTMRVAAQFIRSNFIVTILHAILTDTDSLTPSAFSTSLAFLSELRSHPELDFEKVSQEQLTQLLRSAIQFHQQGIGYRVEVIPGHQDLPQTIRLIPEGPLPLTPPGTAQAGLEQQARPGLISDPSAILQQLASHAQGPGVVVFTPEAGDRAGLEELIKQLPKPLLDRVVLYAMGAVAQRLKAERPELKVIEQEDVEQLVLTLLSMPEADQVSVIGAIKAAQLAQELSAQLPPSVAVQYMEFSVKLRLILSALGIPSWALDRVDTDRLQDVLTRLKAA